MLDRITPLVITFNEAPNIGRTLERLAWAREVVVLDSCSTDETAQIVARFPNARLVSNPFTTLAGQWNFGLQHCGITTDWVLALDADYVLTDGFIDELRSLQSDAAASGYRASFRYCVNGVPLRSGAYPPVVVLFRRELTHVEQDGHCQRARVSGAVAELHQVIDHDDRKPIARWLASQSSYMRLEVEKLARAESSSLATIDRLRKMIVVAPAAMFVYCYVVRGGILDGVPGLMYAMQRAAAEVILSLYLLERRLGVR